MARIRNIKPDFFTDADITEFPPLHRLLFVGLWCQADRAGRLEDKPREIKVKVLPFDDCDVDAMLSDLVRGGFLIRYEVHGRKLIEIENFTKHQHFHRQEKASELPGPTGVATIAQAAEIIKASVEHHAAPVRAPVQHHAAPGVAPGQNAGDLKSEIRDLKSEPGSLRDRLDAEFLRQRGKAYRWTSTEERALASVLGDGEDEVVRRWGIALARKSYPKCSSIGDLVKRWNDYAVPEEGPARASDGIPGPDPGAPPCSIDGCGSPGLKAMWGVRYCYPHLAQAQQQETGT